MKQEYPGDIRPLMKSCALSAQRRQQDLNRISCDLLALKQSLAQTLEKFGAEHAARSVAVQASRNSTLRSLADGQMKRSLALGEFRSRLAQERQRASSGMSKSLHAFRTELSTAVASIKAKTRAAKSMRFKTGSFSIERPMQLLAVQRTAANSAMHSDNKLGPSSNPYDVAKRGGARTFLDQY